MADNSKDSGQVGVFEVAQVPCLNFFLKIVKGHNITKGRWADTLDTPDPYIMIDVKMAPDPKRQTKAFDNNTNPVWNETFMFFLKDVEGNEMELTLMDSNYLSDENLSTKKIKIPRLYDMVEKKQEQTIDFNESSKIEIEMWAEYDNSEPALFYGQGLCGEEQTYLKIRRERSYRVMQELLGQDALKGPNEVPTIAVMGSGGGFRAMTAYSGAMSALVDSKIADMITYSVGLSGSAWYLSTLYSHPEYPQKSPSVLRNEIRKNIESRPNWVSLNPLTWAKYYRAAKSEKIKGQQFSLTDVYGYMIGETLLTGRMNSKLTDQQEKMKEGLVPMPIYASVHVKTTTSAKVFHEWVEFSPYLIGMSKYGSFMRPELFGSKFFQGRLLKKHDESPLHFCQGIWGSAYCILANRFVGVNPEDAGDEEEERDEFSKELSEELAIEAEDESESSGDEDNDDDDKPKDETKVEKRKKKQRSIFKSLYDFLGIDSMVNDIQGRAASVFNYMRGLVVQEYQPSNMLMGTRMFAMPSISTTETTEGQFDEILEMYPTDDKKMYLVDAGLAFNSPYPLILRAERKVDLILSFEFSSRKSDKANPLSELVLAAEWAKLNNIPFPDIDPTVVDREGFKECYVFENPDDPTCPIVMHFILVNKEFRKFKSPGVPRETEEEKDYGDFDIFDDPDKPYATSKFAYTNRAFDRLAGLMEFNTLLCKDLILENVRKCITRKM